MTARGVTSPRRDVVVIGPATWNHVIALDELPPPTPHMQFARDHWWTMGGTSAGKALHLADLGVEQTLVAAIGPDDAGDHVRSQLARGGVRLVEMPGAVATESHTNLMSTTGERVSLYVDPPPAASAASVEVARLAIADATVVVLDLAATGARIAGDDVPLDAEVWVDLHDWDGESNFQVPFVGAANVVVASHERLADIERFLRRCIDDGAELAIVTRGADGSVGMDAAGNTVICAASAVDVVDTNGAGDAFVAGALAARMHGLPLEQMLEAGSKQALRALTSRHLCASLDM
ncbi:carbohydrate kinase family protein [Demequina aurantiaca]|uniref:carbohydrate kinase family protein n=1 Tax=Demequina aurantiaca TaxID=676200 RepID=UPI003D33145F